MIWSWLRRCFRPSQDLSEELEFHFQELRQERLAQGDSPVEAERSARRKLGNRALIQEAVHERSPAGVVEAATRQARLAFRSLDRRRGAYLTATTILALGVGMSAAMYSLVDAVLLRPLPFPGQERIELIWKSDPLAGAHVGELAYPELRDLEQSIPELEYVALMPPSLYGYGKVLQAGEGESIQIEASVVSHDFFRVLGVSAAMGRGFEASDERVGAAPVVVLSDRVWREQLGADPEVIGKLITLNSEGFTVIGVMAPGVEFPRGCGLWTPLGVNQRVIERRGATFLQAIVRLEPGADRERVASRVEELFQRQALDYPEAYSPTQQAVMTPLIDYWTGSAKLHLWIMLGASLLLLAAATISAGNLFLSAAAARRQEIATRAALGAGRLQILTQLGAEGLAAGAIAALCGLLLARFTIAFLVQWAPAFLVQWAPAFLVQWAPADIPRLAEAAIDPASFTLAAGVALLAATSCSLFPAWLFTRFNLAAGLRQSGARASLSAGGGRTQGAFILAQSAVTVALAALAAMLLLSYRSMISADIGFANRDALTMNLSFRGPGLFGPQAFSPEQRDALYSRLLEEVRSSPGVSSAAAILLRPLEGAIGWDISYELAFEDAQADDRTLPKSNYEVITPGYFETLGAPLVEGRDFNEHDDEHGEGVAIISRSLAERIRRAGHQPLGHRVRLALSPRDWLKVVGISADARYRGVTRSGIDIFVPYRQALAPTNYVVVRGTRPAAELEQIVRRALAGIDPSQALAGVATLGELIDRDTARNRFNMIMLLWFGACAAALAAGGVFSVIAESVAARRKEIAIKTALGAGKPRLAREMVARALAFVLAGEALGLVCAAGLGALASELLYGVSPRDSLILGAVMGFVFAVSLAAALAPAWAAAGRPPRAALLES